MERPSTSRLLEYAVFYDYVLGRILEELDEQAKIDTTVKREWGLIGKFKTSAEKSADIRAGRKLSSYDTNTIDVVRRIAQESHLSDTKSSYLFGLIFEPRKSRADND